MDYSIIKKIFYDSFKIDTINYGESKVLTLGHDNDRSFFYNGQYYSPLIDTLEDDLAIKYNIKCISIARLISTIKGSISYGDVRSPEGSFARALIAKRFTSLYNKSDYPYSNMEEKVWGKILDETKAEKVIGILPSRELCMACHKRNIWVADMQHGVIAENHPWYGEKFRAIDKKEYLPHSFNVWDYGSAEVIEKWALQKGIHVNVIGNRWIARFKDPNPSDKLVSETLKTYKEKFIVEEDKKVILVSLSWGQEGITNGMISENIIRIIQKTSKKFKWILRLHPNQIKGFATNEFKIFHKLFEEHLVGHCEWELATFSPLPAVIINCNLHICWNSSVAMECAQFGIKSAMLDPRLRSTLVNDYYDYYKKLGFIDFLKDEEEKITKWIDDNLKVKLNDENYSDYNERYYQLLEFLAGKEK